MENGVINNHESEANREGDCGEIEKLELQKKVTVISRDWVVKVTDFQGKVEAAFAKSDDEYNLQSLVINAMFNHCYFYFIIGYTVTFYF